MTKITTLVRFQRRSCELVALGLCLALPSWAEQERRLFWQVSGELGLALIGADSEVLSQSPEQIAEVSAEPLEYLLLRSPDLGPRSSAAENS